MGSIKKKKKNEHGMDCERHCHAAVKIFGVNPFQFMLTIVI